MRICLIGYGKMGQMIEEIALNRGHSIVARINSNVWDFDGILRADVCMEFTSPNCVIENIKKIAKLKKEIIIGTTGWDDKIDEVKSIIEENHIGALYSPNFSVGVNLLLQMLSYTSKIMNSFEEYDVAGFEHHHNKKKDSPSGTAKAIAKTVEKNIDRIDKLPFSSIRCGSIPGTHSILFDSPCDTISITHEARNREGFALGAIKAAEWLKGKKGLYTFSDCMEEMIKQR